MAENSNEAPPKGVTHRQRASSRDLGAAEVRRLGLPPGVRDVHRRAQGVRAAVRLEGLLRAQLRPGTPASEALRA